MVSSLSSRNILIVSEASGAHRIWAQFLHPVSGNLQFQQQALIDPREWLANPGAGIASPTRPLALLHFPSVIKRIRKIMFDTSIAPAVQQKLRATYQVLLDMNTFHRDLLIMARSDGGMVVFGMEVKM
jgi:hypothetical protein